jgi:hypothetical protein
LEKYLELSHPLSCLNKAAVDEPIFVLRAKDPAASQTVRLWAVMAYRNHEPEKLDEARALADMMDKWRQANIPETSAANAGLGAQRAQLENYDPARNVNTSRGAIRGG